MKSDIENLTWLFQIEDGGGIGGKCICVNLIAINKKLSNCKSTVLFHLVLGKEILNILVTSLELYLVFGSIYSILGPEKNTFLLLLLTVVGGRVDYQAWQEFCRVLLELVCHKCLGQSDIWTSLDGEL